MPLILCECALHRFRQRPPNWTLLIKVSFKFTLALKQWLVCAIFFAIILLHLRTHSSKNYSLIFLHVFTLISSITLLMNIPRMMNQSTLLTRRFMHFIPTIQLTFPKYFFIFFIFYATPRFLPQGRHRTYKRAAGRERPTTRKRARGPRLPRTHPRRRAHPTVLAFPGQSRQETVGAIADG